ncbi:hypothetical protein ACHAXS_010996 [Conticribra weissflogii]
MIVVFRRPPQVLRFPASLLIIHRKTDLGPNVSHSAWGECHAKSVRGTHGWSATASSLPKGRHKSPAVRLPCRINTCLASLSSHAASDGDSESESHDHDLTITEKIRESQQSIRVVEVCEGGGSVTIQYHCNDNGTDQENMRISTYHASWLWSNDPQRVMLPSGQRTSTPGEWIRTSSGNPPSIFDANILYCGLEQNVENDKNHVVHVPGPTLDDSCHPLAIYGRHKSWVKATFSANKSFESDAKLTQIVRPYLRITWNQQSHSNASKISETKESYFDVEWLRRMSYDDLSRMQRKRRTEVQPIHAIRKSGPPLWQATKSSKKESPTVVPEDPERNEDGLIHIRYSSILDSDGKILQSGLFRLLHTVFRDGAAIVSSTPVIDNHSDHHKTTTLSSDKIESLNEEQLPVAQLAKAMSGGALSHGALYGNIFHVRVGERDSNNVAYTSASLCPHQDLAYYESPPGMQLLHCVAMDEGVIGGESTLIDALAAAYRLRELRPESFECLVRCPATFVKQRAGASMTYRRPHIVLAEDGISNTRELMEREIVAVHWSPPFEGPVVLPPGDVDRYYEAYSDFERILDLAVTSEDCDERDELSQYANEFTWERKLSPGEVLVFNNRRMLHGRRGFSFEEGLGQRHLVGCYTNIDDTVNCYRVNLRDMVLKGMKDGDVSPAVMNVGNGTCIIP